MALTEARPLALPSGEGEHDYERPAGVFARPTASTGWRSWVTTVDHKKIGIMYGAAALVFLLIGGFEALLIRLQLWAPRGTLLSRRASTTRCTRCTARRWSSSSSCPSVPPSPTT